MVNVTLYTDSETERVENKCLIRCDGCDEVVEGREKWEGNMAREWAS